MPASQPSLPPPVLAIVPSAHWPLLAPFAWATYLIGPLTHWPRGIELTTAQTTTHAPRKTRQLTTRLYTDAAATAAYIAPPLRSPALLPYKHCTAWCVRRFASKQLRAVRPTATPRATNSSLEVLLDLKKTQIHIMASTDANQPPKASRLAACTFLACGGGSGVRAALTARRSVTAK